MEQPKATYNKTIYDLRDELHNNILSLELLCKQYDEGNFFLAPLVAVVLRTILFSKGGKNSSLLEKTKYERISFVSSVTEHYYPNSKIVISPYMPLLRIKTKGGIGSYESTNTGQSIVSAMFLPFDIWWHQIVLDDRRGGRYSRRDIVLTIADKFGAHSDVKIDKRFADLSFHNSLGFKYEIHGDIHDFQGNPSFESLRQIAQEVLASYSFSTHFQITRLLGTEYMNSYHCKYGTDYDYQSYLKIQKLGPVNIYKEKLFEDTQDTICEVIHITQNEYQDYEGNVMKILTVSKSAKQ